MDDLKERYVMDNFDLNRPDPAEFDSEFLVARLREGLTNAQALHALIAHKRANRPSRPGPGGCTP